MGGGEVKSSGGDLSDSLETRDDSLAEHEEAEENTENVTTVDKHKQSADSDDGQSVQGEH